MSDLDQIKANCAQYGQQRNQLEDQINRDYQSYRIEVRRIFQEICNSKSQAASKKGRIATILIVLSCVIGPLLMIFAVFSIAPFVLGVLVTITGVTIGVIGKNKADAIQMQNRHELDDLRRQINEVFPDLV